MESGVLWREVVTSIHKTHYPDVRAIAHVRR